MNIDKYDFKALVAEANNMVEKHHITLADFYCIHHALSECFNDKESCKALSYDVAKFFKWNGFKVAEPNGEEVNYIIYF